VDLLAPYTDSTSHSLSYNFSDWTVANSQMQFLKLNSILVDDSQTNGPMLISFERLSLVNTTLKDKASLVSVNSFAYSELIIAFRSCNITQTTTDLGSFFEL
jgi:hypothetical protein